MNECAPLRSQENIQTKWFDFLFFLSGVRSLTFWWVFCRWFVALLERVTTHSSLHEEESVSSAARAGLAFVSGFLRRLFVFYSVLFLYRYDMLERTYLSLYLCCHNAVSVVRAWS